MKFLKKQLILLIGAAFFLSGMARADQITVKIDPPRPTIDSPFNIIFEIETSSDEEPFISFDGGKINVQGRSIAHSTSTQLINGQFSVKKSYVVTYSAEVDRPGQFSVREIAVEIDGKKMKHKNVSFDVLKEAEKPRDMFVLALPEKMEAYVGEGLGVSYYLFHKGNVANVEIKEFPKLNKFLKRFYLPNEQDETVEYQGQIFRRSAKYNAKLFSNKPGELTIDPLTLRIQYAERRNNSFGLSGFGIMQYRTKDLRSHPVKINIKPLPTEGVPKSFTGLVGKHEFKLNFARNRYLVNEVIEAKLEITGPGALETINPPVLLNREELEVFDSNSEVAKIDENMARKTIQYTFLARTPFKQGPSSLELSYFDPDKSEYVVVNLEIPEILVSGEATPGRSSERENSEKSEASAENNEKKSEFKTVEVPKVQGLIAPVYVENDKERFFNFATLFWSLMGLVAVALINVCYALWGQKMKMPRDELFRRVQSKGFDYRDFFHFIKRADFAGHKGLKEIINELPLDIKTKRAYLETLEKVEDGYFKKKEQGRIKLSKRHLSEFNEAYENQKVVAGN